MGKTLNTTPYRQEQAAEAAVVALTQNEQHKAIDKRVSATAYNIHAHKRVASDQSSRLSSHWSATVVLLRKKLIGHFLYLSKNVVHFSPKGKLIK